MTTTRGEPDAGGVEDADGDVAVDEATVAAMSGGATVAPIQRRADRLPATAEGTSSAPFGPFDWGLVALTSVIWGSSFLLIAEGLESFEPGVIAWLRVALGFAALAALPATRRTHVQRSDWSRIALLGAVWLTVPMTLFPIAGQWVSSSVSGMLNGALPLFSGFISAFLLRRAPGRNQLIGIAVGFVGVVGISLPSLQGGSETALGAGLVVVAMISYGFAGNLMVPLQQRYGSIAVIWRAQAVGLVLTTPYALTGLGRSSFAWKPFGAVVMLGALGTGVAFVAVGNLMGRVGATRGSVIAYLIPVVALVLGVLIRNEHVEAIAVTGLGLVLVGAYLTSRAGR